MQETRRPFPETARSLPQHTKNTLFAQRKPAPGVERGHAAGSGGSDRLAVDVIHDVAARKNTINARLRGMRLNDNVTGSIELEFSCK